MYIADQDAVQLVAVGKVDRFFALEVTHECFVLRAKVCGRQTDGKVNGHQPGGIRALRFDFLRNGKQRQNKETLVCGFVLLIWDALCGQCIVTAAVFQYIPAVRSGFAFLYTGNDSIPVDGFDLFVAVVDSNKHNINSLRCLYLPYTF